MTSEHRGTSLARNANTPKAITKRKRRHFPGTDVVETLETKMTEEMTTESMTKSEGIQVICAGFGRTGTLSLTEALKRLGYEPYHFVDFKHHQAWAEVANGTRSVDEIIDLIVKDGYNATLENPTSDIYLPILEKYPNAKVILTVRDTPEAFVKSWKILFDTMVITEQRFSWNFPSFLGYIPLFYNLKETRQFMGTTHLGLARGDLTHGWRTHGDEWLAEQYKRHNQHIQDHVDAKQLLVFNVKEGWEPLCQFLGKEVPKDEPFPHAKVNNAEGLLKLRKQFNMIVYGWIPTLLLTAGATAFYFRKPSLFVGSPFSRMSARGEL